VAFDIFGELIDFGFRAHREDIREWMKIEHASRIGSRPHERLGSGNDDCACGRQTMS
jgi:hypothetical protein